MAVNDPSMFGTYNDMLEAQLLLAEPSLQDLTDSLFVVDWLLQIPVPFQRVRHLEITAPFALRTLGPP